jgi:enoyl-CoA hydratase
VIVKNNGAVRTIAINRPHVRNAVNKKTALALHEAFTEFDKDDSAGVAIFCGNGGHFCSGYDLKELAGTKPAELLPVRFSPTASAPMVRCI